MHLCELRRVPDYARPRMSKEGKIQLVCSDLAFEYIRFLQKESRVNYGEMYIPDETLREHFWQMYLSTPDDED